MTSAARSAALLLLVLVGASWLMSSHLTAPFDESHQGCGGWYCLAARNNLRYGSDRFLFAYCIEAGADVPTPRIYANHPPMLGLLLTGSFWLLGEGEGQARLVPLVLSVSAVGLLFLFLSSVLQSGFWGLLGALLAASAPAWVYYGNFVDPQGAGVLFACSGAIWAAQRWHVTGRTRWFSSMLLFLAFGMLFDWPGFFAAGLLGLWAVRGAQKRGVASAALVFGVALALGVSAFLWRSAVNHRFGLPASSTGTLLHRTGLSGLRDDLLQPITLRQLLQKLFEYHRAGFWLPVSVLGLGAASWLGFQSIRRRLPAALGLLLVPLGVAVLHVLVFLQGAYVHDYWQVYLAPGLALPAIWFAAHCARTAPRLDLPIRAAALLCVAFAFAAGRAAAERRWAGQEPALAQLRDAGRHIAASTSPSDYIPLSGQVPMALLYYSDRKLVGGMNPDVLDQSWRQLAPLAGGLLVRDEHLAGFAAMIAKHGLHGPQPLPGVGQFYSTR